MWGCIVFIVSCISYENLYFLLISAKEKTEKPHHMAQIRGHHSPPASLLNGDISVRQQIAAASAGAFLTSIFGIFIRNFMIVIIRKLK
jgi:hypothetical protein